MEDSSGGDTIFGPASALFNSCAPWIASCRRMEALILPGWDLGGGFRTRSIPRIPKRSAGRGSTERRPVAVLWKRWSGCLNQPANHPCLRWRNASRNTISHIPQTPMGAYAKRSWTLRMRATTTPTSALCAACCFTACTLGRRSMWMWSKRPTEMASVTNWSWNPAGRRMISEKSGFPMTTATR